MCQNCPFAVKIDSKQEQKWQEFTFLSTFEIVQRKWKEKNEKSNQDEPSHLEKKKKLKLKK